MIQFSQTQGNVLVLRAGGTISGQDIDAAVTDVESMLADYEEIGVVADMTDLKAMTAQAVAKDFAAEFKFLGDWKRFPKIAVVADNDWLEGLAHAVGAILPQIEVKTFAPDDSEAALAFASSVRSDRIRA